MTLFELVLSALVVIVVVLSTIGIGEWWGRNVPPSDNPFDQWPDW